MTKEHYDNLVSFYNSFMDTINDEVGMRKYYKKNYSFTKQQWAMLKSTGVKLPETFEQFKESIVQQAQSMKKAIDSEKF